MGNEFRTSSAANLDQVIQGVLLGV